MSAVEGRGLCGFDFTKRAAVLRGSRWEAERDVLAGTWAGGGARRQFQKFFEVKLAGVVDGS